MTQSPVTVTYSLEDILKEIKQGLDSLKEDLTDLRKDVSDFRTETKVAIESVKGDIKALDTKVDAIDSRLQKVENEQGTLVKDISDLKGVKSLIIPIIVAVTTSLVTLLIRSLPNP